MKRKTLEEEIQRIKNLNGVINELYHEDNDDYLYNPEYYETDLTYPEKEESDDDDESTINDFSHDMTVPPKGFYEVPSKKSEDDEKDEGHYSLEQSNEIFDKLTAGELGAEEIDQRSLTALINNGIIQFIPDEYEHNLRMKKMPWSTNRMLKGQISYDLGFFKFLKYHSDEAARSIATDRDKFRIFINNAIERHPEREGKRKEFKW